MEMERKRKLEFEVVSTDETYEILYDEIDPPSSNDKSEIDQFQFVDEELPNHFYEMEPPNKTSKMTSQPPNSIVNQEAEFSDSFDENEDCRGHMHGQVQGHLQNNTPHEFAIAVTKPSTQSRDINIGQIDNHISCMICQFCDKKFDTEKELGKAL